MGIGNTKAECTENRTIAECMIHLEKEEVFHVHEDDDPKNASHVLCKDSIQKMAKDLWNDRRKMAGCPICRTGEGRSPLSDAFIRESFAGIIKGCFIKINDLEQNLTNQRSELTQRERTPAARLRRRASFLPFVSNPLGIQSANLARREENLSNMIATAPEVALRKVCDQAARLIESKDITLAKGLKLLAEKEATVDGYRVSIKSLIGRVFELEQRNSLSKADTVKKHRMLEPGPGRDALLIHMVAQLTEGANKSEITKEALQKCLNEYGVSSKTMSGRIFQEYLVFEIQRKHITVSDTSIFENG